MRRKLFSIRPAVTMHGRKFKGPPTVAVMVTVTLLVVADIVLRLGDYNAPSTPGAVTVLSVLAGVLVSYSALYGRALVYDYGFNVETSGDHPVWHLSEENVLPGDEPHPRQTP